MPPRPRLLKLHSGAQVELQDSVDFYRDRGGNSLAERFKQHVEAGFRAIVANPERFPQVKDVPGVRRLRLKHFPFALLFVHRSDHIWVVAVAHGSRKPGYWKKRAS